MINLVYIDDSVDPMLDAYLANNGLVILEPGSTYKTILFDPTCSYTDLLNNPVIKEANIVIIDSRLFENDTAIVKFTGEEVSLLFRKYYPFIETILISQNELDEDSIYVKKFYDKHSSDYVTYYDTHLAPVLTQALKRIKQTKVFAKKLENNNGLDQCIKDRLINTVKGILEYDSLSKADIDSIIAAFKELEGKVYV